MRIHTSLAPDQVRAMITDLPGVYFEHFDVRGSRSHQRAIEVSLSGTAGRRTNSGSHGAGAYEAATWDEWGIFLGRVFRTDPAAKATYYDSGDDFKRKTGGRFGPDFTAADQHRKHRWEWCFGEAICECGAVQRHV
jgi:hypothetical protein